MNKFREVSQLKLKHMTASWTLVTDGWRYQLRLSLKGYVLIFEQHHFRLKFHFLSLFSVTVII